MRKISRRSFLRAAVIGSAALTLGPRVRGARFGSLTKPNLLVFLPDEVRADVVMSDSGSVWAPNIHALAAESFVFDRAYVTHPICSPSRSSLLSGTWPSQTRCTANDDVLPLYVQCLPEMIGDSSYRSGYLGKWHLGDEFSPQHGFQEWASIEDLFKSATHSIKKNALSDYSKFLISKGYRPDFQMRKRRCFSNDLPARLPLELSKAKFLETKACSFLEQHRHEPFVLVVAFFEPHPPYNGPLNNVHPLDTVPVDPTVDNKFGDDMPLRYRLRQEFYRNSLHTPRRFRDVKQRYLGLVTEIDRSIGAILKKTR